MGLMDKFKNLFTDEEIIEEDEDEKVEIKEVKKEEKSKLPTFMREKIEKEEPESKIMSIEDDLDVKKEVKLEDVIEENLSSNHEEKPAFKFPIEFNENDFTETRTSRQEIRSKEKELNEEFEKTKQLYEDYIDETPPKKPKQELKVSELYKDKRENVKEKSNRFRATPIISPIYGVLDKNYDATEVANNRGHNLEDARPSKSIDFDSVRKKAYGNISEEIKENLLCENCEYLKEAKECRRRSQKYEDKIEEYVEDDYSDEDDITMDEAAENYFDYGVEYQKKQPTKKEEKERYYLDEEDDDEVKIVNHAEEESKPTKEIPPVKSSINLLSTLKKSAGDEEEKEKNLELTDDLFNLIDSMYDERNDDK